MTALASPLKSLKEWFRRTFAPGSEKRMAHIGEALVASARRAARSNVITAYRKNGRGLPLGIGPHQVRAAKRIKNALSSRPDEVEIGETRLHAAETTLDAVKRNAQARAKNPRPSKLARRMAALR